MTRLLASASFNIDDMLLRAWLTIIDEMSGLVRWRKVVTELGSSHEFEIQSRWSRPTDKASMRSALGTELGPKSACTRTTTDASANVIPLWSTGGYLSYA